MRRSARRMLTVLVVLLVLLALAVVVDAFFVAHHHVEFPWQRVPGHQGIIGLLASVGVILASRAIGGVLAMGKSTEESPDA